MSTRGRPVEITTEADAMQAVQRKRETTRQWIAQKKKAGWVLYSLWVPRDARMAVALAAEEAREKSLNREH